ncbi:flagellar basal body rod protein FlgB [Clostridium bornimense]|uniref:flagellar basal body rod protein FlgB n=1 Tax=Clostridium bornimense TaxID=1216932 RepID=UPI001C11E76B|nr:flagellar basal body rod protein FlgB [Clostridium bornimense]MBU5314775.1 flagellar basal body rod protein FlgB [Clostridium bornimense]
MSNNISSVAYNLLKDDLNVSALRNRVIANNISNINTAGYKRKYVSFEDTLQNTIKSVSLKTSSEKHISSSSESGDERIITDKSTSTRSDGNNVDIDTEMVNLTANNMMYESLTTALNNRFAMNKIARGN